LSLIRLNFASKNTIKLAIRK